MSGESVKVIVRCRPMNQREKDLKCENIVSIDSQKNQVSLTCLEEKNSPPKQFTFDGAYGIDSNTETIYNDVGFSLVESVCEGYNGTVFAYGQTGCGKSFTMQGTPAQKGIIPRAFEHIFEAVASDTSKKYLIRASYLEIYNENIRDLIGKDYKLTLDLHEHPEKGVYITDLSWHECKKITDCEKLMDKGNKNRSVGATLMNADSSRSHSIFTINVEMCEKDDSGEEHYRAGKLNLVDLAGSERLSKTGATGDRLKEATKINLSLSALGNVISALVDGKSKHIPYRDSKLTRLLQDSLGGNTKTLMISAVSPAADNYEETLSTLRYANRAKNIKNKPKINEDPKDAMLRELQDEIKLLKAQLAGAAPISKVSSVNSMSNRDEIEREKQKLKEEFESKLKEVKDQYEEEKMSKEALMKKMESLKSQYDSQINSLDGKSKPKSSKGVRSASNKKLSSANIAADAALGLDGADPNLDGINDPEQRLLRLQQMVVGGELANDEELKKRRIKKKKYAEDRKKLAESLKKDDDEFMLRVYDNVQEEVQYKTRLLEKESKRVTFLENEVKDLQREFELEREEYLDTIRKQERQLKLLLKLTQKIQPMIPHDSNYFNLDKIQSMAIWNEELQDWILPDVKREKLCLPAMGSKENSELNNSNGYSHQNGVNNNDYDFIDYAGPPPPSAPNGLLNARRQTLNDIQSYSREPEIDRYRLKLENSQFDGTNYFKTKRQSELLSQTQDMKNGHLSPLSNGRNMTKKYY